MTHVLLVPSEEFVPDDQPLSGIFERDQARVLAAAGYQVGVLSVRLEFPVWPAVKQFVHSFLKASRTRAELTNVARSTRARTSRPRCVVEQNENLNVVRVKRGRTNFGSTAAFVDEWCAAARLGYDHYVDRFGEPDVVHAHNAMPAGIFCNRQLPSRKYVVTEHSSAAGRGLLPTAARELVKSAYAGASERLVVSPFLGNELVRQHLLSNYEVVPDVLDETSFAFAEPYAEGPPVFVTVGSLDDNKSQADIIRALQQVRPRVDARLVVIGDGPNLFNLKKLVLDAGVQDAVEFRGALSRLQVAAELRAAHVLVIASCYETFGVSAIESLATGRPVIATRCGGPEYVVGEDEHNGRLVAVGDVQQMAAAMTDVAESLNTFDPITLRDRTVERFGAAALLSRLALTYGRL